MRAPKRPSLTLGWEAFLTRRHDRCRSADSLACGASAGAEGAFTWDRDKVLRQLTEDVKALGTSHGLRPDLILVSGDNAFSGQSAAIRRWIWLGIPLAKEGAKRPEQ